MVATLLKNSNGKSEGEKHALQQIDTGFQEIEDFDFSQCMGGSGGAGGHNEKITEQHIRELFDNGRVRYPKGEAVRRLMALTGAKDKACYAALNANGPRFGHMLTRSRGRRSGWTRSCGRRGRMRRECRPVCILRAGLWGGIVRA